MLKVCEQNIKIHETKSKTRRNFFLKEKKFMRPEWPIKRYVGHKISSLEMNKSRRLKVIWTKK